MMRNKNAWEESLKKENKKSRRNREERRKEAKEKEKEAREREKSCFLDFPSTICSKYVRDLIFFVVFARTTFWFTVRA
jgi:hypothetical protein